MNLSKITITRLNKEEKELEEVAEPNLIVKRKDLLEFHFCLHSLPAPFSVGIYHGKVTLPEKYPFSPPSIEFLTPNGRFKVQQSICTTFTHFHKTKWSHLWTIRTMLVAMISLITDPNEKGLGFLNTNDATKEAYAKASMLYNKKNPEFFQLFQQKLEQAGIKVEQAMKNSTQIDQKSQLLQDKTEQLFKFFRLPEKQQEYLQLLNNHRTRRQNERNKARQERRRQKVQHNRRKREKQLRKKEQKEAELIIVENEEEELV